MSIPRKARKILERMARIEQMERGKLCQMTGRPHYNLQRWQNGRNVVRYVPRDQVESLRKAIEGYENFRKLADQYAEVIITRTRQQQTRQRPSRRSAKRNSSKGKKSI